MLGWGGLFCIIFFAKSYNPFKGAETYKKKFRKHQKLVNSPDSLFKVQDIWEREEAKAFVFIKCNNDTFLQKKNNGL